MELGSQPVGDQMEVVVGIGMKDEKMELELV